jgi:hypothetical protein
MTAARLKRIAALEARKSNGNHWTDPYPVAMQIFAALQANQAAERAGRPFSRLPSPELPDTDAFVWAMRAADQMHARLVADRVWAGA